MPHPCIFITQGSNQRPDSSGEADRAQRPGGDCPHPRIFIAQGIYERP